MSATFVLVLRLLSGLSLYGFLAWALITIWRDLKTHAIDLAERKTPPIKLSLHEKGKSPKQHHFSKPEILIGRDSYCDISLSDDTVSVRHAYLSYHHGQWWVEDLESTNGTRLNNEDINIPTVVISGDKIECGHTAITINLGPDLKSTPTQRIDSKGEFHGE